jgi:H+/Cl- antiporter ClcA
VTGLRFANPWIVWLLPVAGAFSGWIYSRFGQNVEAGNNLIFDQIHSPSSGVPFRMAPFVLLATLLTHLFGGSAGREGTAVQMGGSIASQLGTWLRITRPEEIRLLLKSGIAAGFSGVFGTPVAGAVFALEVLAPGTIASATLVHCLLSAFVSDQVCLMWGIRHSSYSISSVIDLSGGLLSPLSASSIPFILCILLAAIAFGFASRLFCIATYEIGKWASRFVERPWLRPVIGGALVVGFALIPGSESYLGLGVESHAESAITISSCFRSGGAEPLSWFWKLLFTAVTIGFGFKGGEVTPLFFIGAALGNVVAVGTGLPIDLLAGLGFVSVFAAATKTPVASTLMAVEIFGGEYVLMFAASCMIAVQVSGDHSIYRNRSRRNTDQVC